MKGFPVHPSYLLLFLSYRGINNKREQDNQWSSIKDEMIVEGIWS